MDERHQVLLFRTWPKIGGSRQIASTGLLLEPQLFVAITTLGRRGQTRRQAMALVLIG
jgi:hypothetical protein